MQEQKETAENSIMATQITIPAGHSTEWQGPTAEDTTDFACGHIETNLKLAVMAARGAVQGAGENKLCNMHSGTTVA